MIDPNEVMINNWVSYESRYFQMHLISTEYPSLDTIEFGVGVVEWKDLEPIPLDEDWLLKFGFEKSNNMDTFFDIRINNDWTKLYYTPKHGVCEISINSHGCIVKAGHVHQLQNLYFALTGNKLEI